VGTSGEGAARRRADTGGDSLIRRHLGATNRADEGGSSFGSNGDGGAVCGEGEGACGVVGDGGARRRIPLGAEQELPFGT
jgi:hypothetical protein